MRVVVGMHPMVSDPDLRRFLLASIEHARRLADLIDGPTYVCVTSDGGLTVGRKVPGPQCVASMSVVPYMTGEDTMDRLMDFTLRLAALSVPEIDPRVLTSTERKLVEDGKMIHAIKEHRTRTGSGLKDSKDACDAYRDSLPYDHPVQVAKRESAARWAAP